jgi:acyl carrier protein
VTLGRDAIAALVREVVAACSGYPESVLSPKHDLESELGIDSIKRVEIVDEIQRRLPPGLLAQLATKSGELAKAKTLDRMCEILSAAEAAAPVSTNPSVMAGTAVVTASTATTAATTTATLSEQDLLALVREVVAELTGYPTDTLSVQQDMEADLGIDSIKRVEIAEHIVRRLPTELAERLRSRSDELARAKRLQDIDALLLTFLSPGAPAMPGIKIIATAQPATPVLNAEATASACPGYRIVFDPAPLAEASATTTTALVGKRLLLVEGDADLSAALSAQLGALGAHTVLIPWAVASQPDELAKFLATGAAKAVDAVIQLSGSRRAPERPVTRETPRETLAAGESWLNAALHAALPVAQHCLPQWLESRRAPASPTSPASLRWLAVTRAADRNIGAGETGLLAALAGGIAGLLRCLHIEHPEAAVRALDLPANLEAIAAAGIIVRELLLVDAADTAATVSWQDGTRRAMRLQAWSAPEGASGAAFSHVLAIGGIRGITAHSLLTLAGPQTRFSIVARGTPAPSEDPASAAIAGINGLRGYFARALTQAGNVPQAREIERCARAVLRDRAARAALDLLRAAGSPVEVFTADALDRAAVSASIRTIQERFGPPDCVVHGAGIIEDKRLLDKQAESWRRVVDTKLNPVLALGDALDPARLRKMVFFGSVAGSVGNLGQGDYALANEALNFAGLAFAARWPHVSVTTINWGPWAGLGMASDAVNQQFGDRGVKTIPPDAGAEFFRRALWSGPLQLVAGAGYWA